MKILFIVGGDSPGGIERFMSNILPLFKEKAMKIDILCTLSIGNFYYDYYKKYSENIYGPLTKKNSSLKSFKEYYRIMEKSNPDVILSFYYWQAAEQSIASKCLGIPYYVSYRGTAPVRPFVAFLRSLITNNFAKSFIANSSSVANYMSQNLFLWTQKIYNLGNGIEITNFSKISNDPRKYVQEAYKDHLIIGTVARLMAVKDHSKIIEVAKIARAEKKKWHFIWAGDGPIREKYEQLIKQEKLEEYITILGFIPSNYELYSSFDIFLLTSKSEGLSQALVEACAAGKSVIGANVNGIKDVIENGKNGLLVQQDDIKAYFDAITQIEEDKHFKAKIEQEAQSTARQYDIQEVFQRYLNLLTKVDA